jgi:hypothetical protein
LFLLKDAEPSLCFEMISHWLWHLAGTECAKIQFLRTMVAIHGQEYTLYVNHDKLVKDEKKK